MIKVNLIPVKEKKKRKEFFIILCIVSVVVLISLGMAWVYGLRLGVKNSLNKEIAQVDEESKGYQEKINEEKDLESKEASLESFKKTVKGISDAQRKAIIAIDQFALNLPDGVWITSITQGKDGNLFTIQGYAFTETNLQNYFNAIQKPGGILKEATVTINNISASVANNRQINQFTISAKITDVSS